MKDEADPSRWLAPRLHVASTDAVAARERFDFWHSLWGGVELSPLGEPNRPYHATALSCAGDDGLLFADIGCAPTGARISEDGNESMRLHVLTQGSINVSHGDDERMVVSPGPGLYLFDYARQSTADSVTGYRGFVIEMPRAIAYRSMGGDPIPGRGAIRSLPETPLSLMLKALLHSLARGAREMDAHELDAAMKALSGLTLSYLQRFNRDPGDPDRADDALFLAACQYIDATMHDAAVTAGTVASALGCSRARLYRSFERRGLAVSDQIRATRLNHGRTLLRDRTLDVGEVALRCGYADQSSFGKAFRRRFGMSPRDWRGALQDGDIQIGKIILTS